jgi:hypothetical protein
MKTSVRWFPALSAVACLSMASCAPLASAPDRPSDVSFARGGIVLAGTALEDGPGTLLDAMAGKVPNLRIRRSNERCPQIALRSAVLQNGIVSPQVYVDGTRSTDTCILESLRSYDVARVEVYPQGFTTRPGYGRSAHGLILVFMRAM